MGMPTRTGNPDLIVIGGGVIGLAVAWRARERGLAVTVLERELAGGGTSRVAAGMLAPVSEVEFGQAGGRMLELGLRSAAQWPRFAAELEAVSQQPVGLLRAGTLMVAKDADEARELERQLAFRTSLGVRATRVRASRARELEPGLAPSIPEACSRRWARPARPPEWSCASARRSRACCSTAPRSPVSSSRERSACRRRPW